MRRTVLVVVGCVLAATVAALVATGRVDSEPYGTADATPAPITEVVAYQPIDPTQPPGEACARDLSCLRQYYQNLTWQSGPVVALEAITAHSLANPDIETVCHDTLHAVGEIVGRSESLGNGLALGDERCGSGYYHGVVASYLIERDIVDLIPVLEEACTQTGDHHIRWECYHGVGHSMNFATNGDPVLAAEQCLRIESDVDRSPCASGVFMQEVIDHGRDPSRYSADPYATCRRVSDDLLREHCFDMHAVIVGFQRAEPAQRFEVCTTVDVEYQYRCALGLGRALFGGKPHDAAQSEEFCSAAGNDEWFMLCVEGIVTNTAGYYGSGDLASQHCWDFSTEQLVERCFTVLVSDWRDTTMPERFDVRPEPSTG